MEKKKITPESNHTNQWNSNRGMPGVNKQYAKAQGNRGKQLNGKVKK
ncbi:hypothetical protein EZS27_009722 [termite gut metagenome]|uniref:Uncharacterized protein n=1 Tax=termite gut metagenome TaxID=433724 RepID=A0A5J4S8W3_9ZZZZ